MSRLGDTGLVLGAEQMEIGRRLHPPPRTALGNDSPVRKFSGMQVPKIEIGNALISADYLSTAVTGHSETLASVLPS